VHVHSLTLMGTVVTFRVVGAADGDARAHIDDAVEWFRHVEACCNRFDVSSEVQRLARTHDTAVPVSETLLHTVQFALALAEESGGAFDPTVGARMERRGFDREYRTGERVVTDAHVSSDVSYRDVHLDADNKTITLARPLLLDLGAVAKGLAVDMAARALAPLENFAIDAGGDVYLAGHNADGDAWSVGIRHPRHDGELLDTLRGSNAAVCTSGDYERVSDIGHHIIDPKSGDAANSVASVTVVAPVAMVADGLATTAFVLGAERGVALLEKHAVEGIIVTPSLERYETRGVPRG
jgi:thiamine biosynthesis lipoprotein